MLPEALLDHTVLTVAAGAVLLGLASGALGTFAVLRRQSLLGDVMSHAALPGVVGGYLVAGTRSLPAMLAGALVTGLLAAALAWLLSSRLRVKSEAALGSALGLGFALGVVLLSYVQRQPGAGSAGLETFLFGQAAATLRSDVWVLLGVAVVALGAVTLVFGELELATFDPVYARARGHRVDLIDAGLTGLLAVAVVIGLQLVGVVLMSALVVAPAVAARQLTRGLRAMFWTAGAVGALSALAGALVSAATPGLATGPVVVLVVSVVAALALLLGPERGRSAEA
ncbi:MAG TPA: metal ABC transporter permease [Trueperaceae bacterium]|nr:metal ABC transporter permease [Trueperaceae bacterium]